MNAGVVACVSCPQHQVFRGYIWVKNCDLHGWPWGLFFLSLSLRAGPMGWSLPFTPRCLCSVKRRAATAPQPRRNKSFISFSSLHVFVAVWQRNHLFPVDGRVPALHTNRVHHVAGGDTSSFTHLRTFVFGRISSLRKRWRLGQWVFSNRLSQF